MKSSDNTIRFAEFRLDPINRRLLKGEAPVELGARYFDALVMLVGARGELVSKDRLHEEVWRGVPVTDEALSQAIMALRRALGDEASRPRFIETVPRHGYRFVGEVIESTTPNPAALSNTSFPSSTDQRLRLMAGGVTGAAVAGLLVGLVYGSLSAGTGASGGALSLMLVLMGVSVLAALVSGLGIVGGIALIGSGAGGWWRPVAGGALGGMIVGGFARLLGLDTLRLLTGIAPDRIAGSGEGLVIGLCVGLAYSLSAGRANIVRYGSGAGLGALGGLALVLAGGTLMAGSLAALIGRFPSAGLSMEWVARPVQHAASGAFEGALFVALAIVGMVRARP